MIFIITSTEGAAKRTSHITTHIVRPPHTRPSVQLLCRGGTQLYTSRLPHCPTSTPRPIEVHVCARSHPPSSHHPAPPATLHGRVAPSPASPPPPSACLSVYLTPLPAAGAAAADRESTKGGQHYSTPPRRCRTPHAARRARVASAAREGTGCARADQAECDIHSVSYFLVAAFHLEMNCSGSANSLYSPARGGGSG